MVSGLSLNSLAMAPKVQSMNANVIVARSVKSKEIYYEQQEVDVVKSVQSVMQGGVLNE